MKMIKRVAMSITALVFIGSSVFAQSLADAKKAIDAEQYQKAKSMLKNLTVTQPTSDENYFYLGWVYIKQDYADSAKAAFSKGISINPKSALNYAGLGAVARLEKDAAGATTSFNQAITLAGKDTKVYLYVGKAYLLLVPPAKAVSSANADAAIAVLEKSKVVNTKLKDAEVMVTEGNAYLSQLKSNDAYKNYSDALAADPKSVTANVAEGVQWRLANNWESAESQFKAALAIDPNYGPAYREWAETNLRQANNDLKVASAKVKEGVEHYRTYLSLTDNSLESQLRYADFLYNAGDYATLQQVATEMTKTSKSDLRVYRYIGYAALQTKDYDAGIGALKKFIAEAGEKRILANDYLVLGKLQQAKGDSTFIVSYKLAYGLDSTKADVFAEIAKSNYDKKKYLQAALDYQEYFDKSHKGTLTEHFFQANGYYFAFIKAPEGSKPDSALLTKADTVYGYINSKLAKPNLSAVEYRAYIADMKDVDRNNIKGLAKPYYEQIVALITANPTPSANDKIDLAAAYVYLANLAEYKDKDDAKTLELYTKAKDADPTNKSVVAYFARPPATKAK